jgi:hypothetical protein
VAIGFVITVPIVGLLNSMARGEGIDEFEYLISQLQQGALWSVFTIIGYLFLLGWWLLFVFNRELLISSK